MKGLLFIPLFSLYCVCLHAQRTPKKLLLKSWPISVTPLSFWDSDISTSAGIEYRFHPSFSIRVATDYIYGDYSWEHSRTSGFRIRPEFRYYIAGNKLISSRSKVWPYFSIAYGNKWVTTKFSDWYYTSTNNQGFERWRTYKTHNREWHLLGRTGMQSAFGRQKRFLFDISFGVGVSNNKVSFSFPDGEDLRSQVLTDNTYSNETTSFNKYSGKFTGFNFEACFGYRLLK
jgi:hypothetical protein